MAMEHFDQLVTDPAVTLAEVQAHLAALAGNERLHGRYWVAATSGTTGRRGIFLWDLDEWVTVLASYNRSLDWAGATADLTRRLPMAVVSSTTPWHQSARVGATVRSPWVQTLRLRCPCGRPFALIEGIQGRVEEALSFPARSGGQVTVQPAVVHGVMDGVPAEGWQLVQEPERLAVLLAGVPDSFDEDGLADRLRRELRSRGALPPPVQVQRVRAIPRTALGKAPLSTRRT